MPSSTRTIILLLLGSGFCGLVYQVTWMRMLRLVFGASTASSAAVLAIFMGGLGVGALWLGRWVERSRHPLRVYAHLEIGIALLVMLSPVLIWAVRFFYTSLGGTMVLGPFWGNALRLFLSALVLGFPAVLMGGTLPAAVRAAESAEDERRARVGLIYGANTLGAVFGAFLATFYLFEVFGARNTLWVACLLNLLIAMIARALSRNPIFEVAAEAPVQEATDPAEADVIDAETGGASAPIFFLLLASGVVGFVFFLMELVWYRMLGPILGGSTYSFGLILTMALSGIGVGGFCYGIFGTKRPSLWGFALTCVLEACFLGLPFFWGEQFALFASYLQPVMSFGFLAVVGVWSLLAFLVVFPTAFLAGFQFPLLIALFGKGQKGVAQDLGRAYLWNTTGSILGSLLGGFGLLPLLSATGVWRMNIILLLVLAAATALFAITRTQRFSPALGLLGAGGVALFFCISPGPGKIWRHTPIGAQRFQLSPLLSTNQKQDILNRYKRTIIWQKDGVELGLGMRAGSALSFIVNGKNDGNAINDAVTSIALGWLGTVLHQQPKRALVIGLGTGATAGWLARAPGIERVDVFELEPAIEKVARRSTHVNEDLFNNPKVHLHYADAREVLLAIPKKYDLIISAPSNPFRAGIVSLFTREFYQSVKKRLRPGGILVQWIQGYEVGPETIQTTLATLQAEFENVETWEAKLGADLLLVASPKPLRYTYESLKERMKHPYHDRAIRTIWGVTGVHGLLTGYVGNHKLTKELAKAHVGDLNTDDFPRIEFGLVGHMIDKTRRFSVGMLYQLAGKLGMDRPSFGERIDWGKVDELRAVRGASTRSIIPPSRSSDRDVQRRIAARQAFLQNRPHKARALWKWGKDKPLSSFDRLLLSSLFYKKAKAAGWLARLRKHHKTDVLFLDAFHALTKGQLKTSTTLLQKGFLQARTNPWVYRPLLELAMDQAALIGRRDAVLGRMLFKTLQVPFSTMLVDDLRRRNLIKMAVNTDFYGLCRAAFVALEPHIPWTKDALERRWLCYDAHKHPLRAKAYEDLKRFVKQRVTAMRHHVYRYVPLGPPPKPRRWRPVPKPRAVARQILPRKVLPLRKPKAASRPSVPASVPTSQPTR